ncbi:sirohydrochlorin chelatase [Amycolatopsis suaedae]|uniref:Sirohydrochlorin chelatase n=1 Tax=Amycolatopsis suaedae TaxID=2510978 RepID=A0A4Q7IZC4_9PSEU|nr:sirohydrochlorin chelatase [Amycolatopsis suaedae]RZQ60390.1 sirohydrochlorin chelatase [Amycolatopsis suaedae]
MTRALLAVAHGSRDPRSAATIRALTERVRATAPDLVVREAFLDLSEPSVPGALAGLHARGHRDVVVVPLLLGSAYHARVDLPALLERATAELPGLTVTTSAVLGTDPVLTGLATDRLLATGADPADPELGVLLAAVGSSHAPANDAVSRLAARWQAVHGCRVSAAFASAAAPDVPAALARLRAKGARRFAVASWFLAPGLLPDRVARLAGAGVAMAAPLGPDQRVADLVLTRYRETVAGALRSA